MKSLLITKIVNICLLSFTEQCGTYQISLTPGAPHNPFSFSNIPLLWSFNLMFGAFSHICSIQRMYIGLISANFIFITFKCFIFNFFYSTIIFMFTCCSSTNHHLLLYKDEVLKYSNLKTKKNSSRVFTFL